MRAVYFALFAGVLFAVAPRAAHAETAAELNDRALTLYNAGEYQDSITLFERAINLAPGEDVLVRNLANAHAAYAQQLADRGATAEAVSHFLAAQRLAPDLQPAYVGLIGAYYTAGEHRHAMDAIQPYLRRFPNDQAIRELYGELLYRSGNVTQAVKEWRNVKKAGGGSANLDQRLAKAERELQVEGDFDREDSEYFTVRYEGDRMEDAGYQALRYCREARKDIGRELRLYPKNKVEVVLYASDQFDSATQQQSHVAGLYDGKIRIRVPGGPLDAAYLRRVVYHEYTHLVVGELTQHKCPFWLNEGLAQELSEPFDAEHQQELRALAGSSGLLSAGSLEDLNVYSSGATDLSNANLVAFALAHHLRQRYSSRNLLQMFDLLRSGESGEQALQHSYRLTYALLDGAIADSVR